MASVKEVAQAIAPVCDPEIRLSIVDLGLIYGIRLENSTATVEMTLTSPMCPYGAVLKDMVVSAAKSAPGVSDAQVALVWEPAWDPHTMASDEAKVDLGLSW
jgi:metal-sulfur cluster biosynthetic enzyme